MQSRKLLEILSSSVSFVPLGFWCESINHRGTEDTQVAQRKTDRIAELSRDHRR